MSGLVDRGDGGSCGCGVAGVCVSAGGVCVSLGVMCVCVCSSSSAVARRVCPRDRATASGRRPSESGIPRAELFQPYRSSAALWWPRAHAHIWNTHTHAKHVSWKHVSWKHVTTSEQVLNHDPCYVLQHP